MRLTHTLRPLLSLAALASLAACNAKADPAQPADHAHHADHAQHAAHAPAAQPAQPAPAARVFFVSPSDGATVKSPLKVVFGLEGMRVRPAGEDVTDQTSGHHHLIIDGAFVPKGGVVPMDAQHIHFGKGQTETEVTLTPGAHTLTMQLADGAHISYGEPLSATIKVVVE